MTKQNSKLARLKLYCSYLFAIFSLLSLNPAAASQIDIAHISADINQPVLINKPEADLLLIPSPDTNGVSRVAFDRIHLDKELQLINAASLNSNLRVRGEASYIILELSSSFSSSESFSIASNLKLIGRQADLLILTRGQDFSCNGCAFSNFPRVTMSTGIYAQSTDAEPSYRITESSLNDYLQLALNNEADRFLIHTRQGSAHITNGMSAKGAVFVDILAKEVHIEGNITTNLRATSSGTIDLNGPKVLSSGAIQVFAGETHLDYFNASIASRDASTPSLIDSSGAVISSGSILFSSYGQIDATNVSMKLNETTIDTFGDLSLVNVYRGKNVILDGKLALEALGDIHIEASELVPGASVDISAFNVRVGEESVIGRVNEADLFGDINIAVDKGLFNFGFIGGDNLKVASNVTINEGEIILEKNVLIHADGSRGEIFNRFGGLISGDQVLLDASFEVMNGQYYPYRVAPIEDALNLPSDIKPLETGLYEELVIELPDGHQKLHVPSLKAVILGEDITIRSPSLQNINPYYVLHSEDSNNLTGALDSRRSDEVIISAYDNLTIEALGESEPVPGTGPDLVLGEPWRQKYRVYYSSFGRVINSSAVIEAVKGELAIVSSILENKRYKIEVELEVGSELPSDFCSRTKFCALQNDQSVDTDVAHEYVSFFSPAGRIYSGGRGLFNLDSGFINALSFVEVHGDLDANLWGFWQYGYDLSTEVSVDLSTSHSYTWCSRSVAGVCLNRKTERWRTHRYSSELFKIGSIPALFSVAGYLTGNGEDTFKTTDLNHINPTLDIACLFREVGCFEYDRERFESAESASLGQGWQYIWGLYSAKRYELYESDSTCDNNHFGTRFCAIYGSYWGGTF